MLGNDRNAAKEAWEHLAQPPTVEGGVVVDMSLGVYRLTDMNVKAFQIPNPNRDPHASLIFKPNMDEC